MRNSLMHIFKALRRQGPAWMGSKFAPRDETLLFSDEQVRFLAARDVIYLTERTDGQYSTIIAHDFGMAVRIAHRRSGNEVVVGLMGPGFLSHLRESTARSHHVEVGSFAHGQKTYA